MPGYKDYRSVSEFPLHVETLSQEELVQAYQDLRGTYGSLVKSRAQLVRRQTEAKQSLVVLNQKVQHLTTTLEKLQQEKQQLQKSLTHSVEMQKQLENWGKDLQGEVDDLQAQIGATTRLLGEFETIYEEVREETGLFSSWSRLQRLLTAAYRLLNTDLKTLMPMKPAAPANDDVTNDDWTQETPANINRSLLDDR